jgi:hypothetical protein
MVRTGGGQPRSGKGKFVRSIDTAERDAEACRLRTQGRNYREIAAALGMADPAIAKRAVERALLAVVDEAARPVRILELARLDLMLGRAWTVLQAEHIAVSQGRVIIDPRTGEPMIDYGPVLAAIDRVLKIQERRAKYLGLDAPVKVEAITVDQIEAEIAKLAAELGMTDERPQVH